MTSKGVSLADMRSSVPGLPSSKYKVAVAWNPLTNTDVGWLTLEKEVEVRLSVHDVPGEYLCQVGSWREGGTRLQFRTFVLQPEKKTSSKNV